VLLIVFTEFCHSDEEPTPVPYSTQVTGAILVSLYILFSVTLSIPNSILAGIIAFLCYTLITMQTSLISLPNADAIGSSESFGLIALEIKVPIFLAIFILYFKSIY
jgi:hypothetical protein